MVTRGTPSFGSARYRASPLSHVCGQVTARASRLRVSARPRTGFQRILSGFAGSVNLGASGWAWRHSAGNCPNGERNRRKQAVTTSPSSQFCSASSPVLFSGCYDPLAALHSSWFRAAPAPYRLRDSTFNLSMVRRDLALPIPAATRAEAVFGARPVSALQPNPSPTWRLLGTVGQCGGP